MIENEGQAEDSPAANDASESTPADAPEQAPAANPADPGPIIPESIFRGGRPPSGDTATKAPDEGGDVVRLVENDEGTGDSDRADETR